jgi:hypothetical protein
MHIDYHLRPIEEVDAWGEPGDLRVHWFALTDGFYRIDLGQTKLLDYSRDAVRKGPSEPFPTYVDYHVARLWEDLGAILPAILVPVPERFHGYIEEPLRWQRVCDAWVHSFPEETPQAGEAQEIAYAASAWIGERQLSISHLVSGPRIWFWTRSEQVVVHWDNVNLMIDDAPAWSATKGTVEMPIGDFVKALTTFNDSLMRDMEARVNEVERHWNRPGVAVDISRIKSEHQVREQEFARWLSRRQETDWREVERGIELIENEPF